MKSLGILLKEARRKKRLTISHVAQETKIKEKFLAALEDEDWQRLPSFSTTRGFTIAYAKAVDVDPSYAVALLRRDFPPSSDSQGKTIGTLLDTRFVWTPRLTLLAIVFVAALVSGIYLVRQYMIYSMPPPLNVEIRKEGEKIIVIGKTVSTATVEVDREKVVVDDKGKFRFEIRQAEAGRTIKVKAVSRTGKETVVEKRID